MFADAGFWVLDALNSRWIYGRLPLLATLVLLIEIMVLVRLATAFNSYYNEKPVLTTMITNATLGGVADTLAQLITSVRERSLRKPGGITKDDRVSIEIHNLDQRLPFTERELIPKSSVLPPPFDFARLTRFMAYGFIMSPIQFKWFQFMSKSFPITKASSFGPVLKSVACDQLIFAPFGLGCFFTFMTVAEGGGKKAISRKFQDAYLPTLKANFMLWPLVQLLNFRYIPQQYKIPFVSTVGIAWTIYLSLTNAAPPSDKD